MSRWPCPLSRLRERARVRASAFARAQLQPSLPALTPTLSRKREREQMP
jgi:hypothetical protein